MLQTICMNRLNLILVLFTFGFYGWFVYKCVVQMWSSNNVMTSLYQKKKMKIGN